MKLKIWPVLLLLIHLPLVSHADSPCYKGHLSIRLGAAGSALVLLSFQIKDDFLTAEVLNPDDILIAKDKRMTVAEGFKPGPPVKLIPLTGIKCPTCTAYTSESGKFTFIVEQLGGGEKRTKMDYFGLSAKLDKIESCEESAKATEPKLPTAPSAAPVAPANQGDDVRTGR